MLSLVMPSPTTPLSFENAVIVGPPGAAVSTVTALKLSTVAADVTRRIGGLGSETVSAIGRESVSRNDQLPLAFAVAEPSRCRTVIRSATVLPASGGAAEQQCIVIGQAIPDDATVIGEMPRWSVALGPPCRW